MAIVNMDALRSKAFASITGSYTTLGTALTANWRVFKITNNTNGDMLISLDGTTDNLFIPQSSFTLYDLSTNAANVQDSDGFVMKIGSQFYVKYSTAPTGPVGGAVYVEGLFTTGV
jgi:hypothetical protein